jgi:hypothetical protein
VATVATIEARLFGWPEKMSARRSRAKKDRTT